MTGVWRVSFRLRSIVDSGESNRVYIYHNNQKIEETMHFTYSKENVVESFRGRELITRAERVNTIYLGIGTMKNGFYNIIACFEFFLSL